MKILVTGGAGFLGSHLCRFLLKNNGDKVICMDNFFTGKRKNIRDIENNINFEVIPHDIAEPIKLSGSFDQIYNLACPASPVHYQFDPIETIKANTQGVINVLEFAKLNGATILQASTSEIYGDPLEHPQKEDYRGNVNTLGPRACYDEGKRVAETLFSDYSRKFGLPIRIARIFNTYGPNMDVNDGRVVSNFIMQALRNQPITIYGSGQQTRSFCYVDDLINGLVKLMNSDNHVFNDKENLYPINLGNPREFTISELATKIIYLTNSKSSIVYHDLPRDDPKQRQPDITRAKTILEWEPKIPLDDGLARTIDYFRTLI